MKTTWDIVEVVTGNGVTEPNAEVMTRNRRNLSRVAGAIATSVCAATLAVSPATQGSATQLQASAPYAFASTLGRVDLHSVRRARRGVTRNSVSATDTQVGRSTTRLAKLLPSYFEPAQEEAEYDADYSFF